MILNDKEASARINSPLNLINRLRDGVKKSSSMSLFMPSPTAREEKKRDEEEVKVTFNPFKPVSERESLQTFATSLTAQQVQASSDSDPRIGDILNDADTKIKLGHAHDQALALLSNSLNALALKLDDVKADKLPSVIAAASRTVESIRRERAETIKNGKDREVHYHFYTPQQRKLEEYQVIEVGG